MVKRVQQHVYFDPVAAVSVLKDEPQKGQVSFLAADDLFVFQMNRAALQRLGRQIDAELKAAPPFARK